MDAIDWIRQLLCDNQVVTTYWITWDLCSQPHYSRLLSDSAWDHIQLRDQNCGFAWIRQISNQLSQQSCKSLPWKKQMLKNTDQLSEQLCCKAHHECVYTTYLYKQTVSPHEQPSSICTWILLRTLHFGTLWLAS